MKTKIKDKKYESFIDDILYLDELLEMLKNKISHNQIRRK